MAACSPHKAPPIDHYKDGARHYRWGWDCDPWPRSGQARRDYLAGYTAAENAASDRHHII